MLELTFMEEIGVIKKIDGVMATVVVEKKSACDQCKQGCKVTEGGAEIEALNLAKAELGNTVKVQMKPFTYLKGTLLVYGFPVLALISGAVAGREWIPKYITTVDKDLLSAFSGFLALLVAFIIVKFIAAKSEKNVELKPVIAEVVSK
ncbi:MAG: SoxR reducing system RseC family protein [Thermodesulfovibrionales bacterium]